MSKIVERPSEVLGQTVKVRRERAAWEFLGYATVDAGMLMVGDPCYVNIENHKDHPVHDWDKLCLMLDDEQGRAVPGVQLHHKPGHAGLGVIAHVGDDGLFVVEGKLDSRGNVSQIRARRGNVWDVEAYKLAPRKVSP